ncbi:uncharacterized protein [Palaemon carinicauda]|uniref:uncharacterized protein n=1 Tax=Palaemon carinicauda TaxID=392227 RepID=UPI0035B6616C
MEGETKLNGMLNGELLEEVDKFKYLGSVVAANGGVDVDVCQRVNERCKVLWVVRRVIKNRGLEMNVKTILYEKLIVPTVVYRLELCGMKVMDRQKLNVFEMKCHRSMAEVSRLEWIRNEEVRVRTGVSNELAARVDMIVSRWFGHVKRIEYGRVQKVINAQVDGRSTRERQGLSGWMK